MLKYRNNDGQTYSVKVTGTNQGSVWGGSNGIYTDDSRLGKAAVHAGLLKVGQEGVVKVIIVAGQQKYTGNTQNGITTNNYGAYQGSYRFIGKASNTTSTANNSGTVSTTSGIISNPGSMTSYRKNTGQTFSVKVTGTDQGSVWGGSNGIYTDDSRLGKAAVHAGLLKVGQEGVVKVAIIAGQQKYTGNTQNGITTNNYGAYQGSYKFIGNATNTTNTENTTSTVSTTTGIINDPGSMTSYRKNTGLTYSVKVTGTDQGSVWGGSNGIYTDDSRLGKAAVHAGLLRIGETGVVKVTILEGQSSYKGSTDNGISTTNYGSYQGSYKFEEGSGGTLSVAEINKDPGNIVSLRNNNGRIYSIRVTGTNQGSVWGGADGVYTDDSRLGKAAVHAGLLKVGQEGIVKVYILPGQQKYTGNTQNGISTINYGSFSGSFRFE
jgi:archaellum component FlaG (FlaF/FlaG flagellin family)